MKKPDETLLHYVKRRMGEEGPMTAAQEKAAFIDGNAQREGAAVVIALGAGRDAKQIPVVDEHARMPTTDCTDDDQGVGFVIGVGSNAPERESDANPAASPTSPRATRRGGTKSK